MKKRLLFIAPDYYGFSQVVLDGLKKYSGYEVEYINSTGKYKYRNIFERIHNFFLKNLCKKNLKVIRKGQDIKNMILKSEYDTLLVIGPYTLNDEVLDLALEKAKHSIVVFWDSIAKIPSQETYIKKFDVCYSFDKNDCKKYGLKEITNFYFIEDKNENPLFDISYLATYDHRINDTISIFDYFEKYRIKAKGKIFTYPCHPIKENIPESIEEIHEIIPFLESYKYYLDSKVILDIAHPYQIGLSFRPFEAMGMSKKLITTNKDIINYDFYNSSNIFIIDNPSNFSIPQSFLKNEYQEPEFSIKEKYYIQTWIKTIIG